MICSCWCDRSILYYLTWKTNKQNRNNNNNSNNNNNKKKRDKVSWKGASFSSGEHAMPCHAMPYRTVPYRTVPYRTVPYHTIPYHTRPHHKSYQIISSSAVPVPSNSFPEWRTVPVKDDILFPVKLEEKIVSHGDLPRYVQSWLPPNSFWLKIYPKVHIEPPTLVEIIWSRPCQCLLEVSSD